MTDTLKGCPNNPYHLTSDEYRCRECGMVWGVDEPRPACKYIVAPTTESTHMKFDTYTFMTRDAARTWLLAHDFKPLDRKNVPGLWSNDEHTIQAFANLSGSWTVQIYDEPHPDNFILS